MQLKKFLETVSVGVRTEVIDLVKNREKTAKEELHQRFFRGDHEFNFPSEVDLYCDSERCKSLTYFELDNKYDSAGKVQLEQSILLEYTCRNCKRTKAKFALAVNLPIKENSADFSGPGEVQKFGQEPLNREPIPNNVMKMIGSEREYFFKGLKSESLGLGISAFVYYRRVIEHQKNRIFGEILKAAEKLDSPEELLNQIKEAQNETQFSKSIDIMKLALPDKILIQGHNPLKLLYSALSEGLHNENDDECLLLAKSIRLILIEFASKLDQINYENIELSNAIAKLSSKQKPKDNVQQS